ncbi:hypothetical protein [Streptomyces sp. NPDC007369]
MEDLVVAVVRISILLAIASWRMSLSATPRQNQPPASRFRTRPTP